jgi:hypothetical protein
VATDAVLALCQAEERSLSPQCNPRGVCASQRSDSGHMPTSEPVMTGSHLHHLLHPVAGTKGQSINKIMGCEMDD